MAATYSEKVFFNGFDENYLLSLAVGATATIGITVNLQPGLFIAVRDVFRLCKMPEAQALQ
ncbi:hypothetical protein [Sodalis sp. (in: enterobacteria)]|uniref:hypothetical protein n=1 Tax=Sodalis sp. (in: enterobacteria) TaxID=1898979 RepID=UPI003F683CA5